MKSKFESERSRFYKLIFLYGLIPVFFIFLILGIMHWYTLTNFLFGLVGSFIIIGLCLWFWNGIYYNITDTLLIVNFGTFKKTIPLRDIIAIKLNQKPTGSSSWWSASLSLNGIVIYYKKKMIYISPKDQDGFLIKLRELNKKIEIKS